MQTDPSTLLRRARRAMFVAWLGMTPTLRGQDPTFVLPDPRQQADALVTAARALPFVAGGLLAYGRELGPPCPLEQRQAHQAAMQAACGLAWQQPQRLAELLDHEEPKVRLVAAWGLYQLADARWLPALGTVAGDDAVIPSRQVMLGWLDDEEQFSQVWPDVLETLRVGEQPPGLGRAGG